MGQDANSAQKKAVSNVICVFAYSVADTKIIFWYDFVAPLIFLKENKKILLLKRILMKTSNCQKGVGKEETLNCVFLWKITIDSFIMC